VQEAEFHDVVDDIVMQLEDELEDYPEDLDVENASGILTVQFPNGSTVVLSRQVATLEIWVAAKSGGFHLKHQDGSWVCGTTDETLPVLISRVFSEQLGREVELLA
jgi:CyaY protein